MSKPDPPEDVPPADLVLIEGSTAQQALEEVTKRFGARARILGVKKIRRGGVGGFFTKELIQLRVQTNASGTRDASESHDSGRESQVGSGQVEPRDQPLPSPAPAPLADEGTPAIAKMLSTLTENVDARERVFADELRDRVRAGDTVATPPPAQPVRAGEHLGSPRPPADAGVRQPLAPQPLSGDPAAHNMTDRAPVSQEAPGGQPERQQVVAWHPLDPRALATERLVSQPVVPDPVVPEPASGPVPAIVQPVPAGEISPFGGSVPDDPVDGRLWDPAKLRGLGVPELVAQALKGDEDEIEGLRAVAAAVASLCRPLPSGVPVLAGPRAAVLAPVLGIPLVQPPGPMPATGPVAAKVGKRYVQWLERNRGPRWLHLVVGGGGWEALRDHQPLAVSWTEAANLPAALRLAAEGGLVIGYAGSASTRRAGPVDVAIAVRELLVAR